MEHGFFRSLFDLSFTSFITTKIIKLVYVVAPRAGGAVSAVVCVVVAFRVDPAYGVLALLLACAARRAHLHRPDAPVARDRHPGVPHH